MYASMRGKVTQPLISGNKPYISRCMVNWEKKKGQQGGLAYTEAITSSPQEPCMCLWHIFRVALNTILISPWLKGRQITIALEVERQSLEEPTAKFVSACSSFVVQPQNVVLARLRLVDDPVLIEATVKTIPWLPNYVTLRMGLSIMDQIH